MLGSLGLAGAPAAAEPDRPGSVRIEYDVSPTLSGCPGEAELRAMVTQKLGYDPHRSDAQRAIEVRVRPVESGLGGTIQWRDGARPGVGERHFSTPNDDCRELVTTLAFVVAVQIQLMATEPQTPPEREATPPRPPPPSEPPVAPAATPAPARHRSRPRLAPPPRRTSLSFGAGPLVDFGLAPRASGGGRAFLALAHGWFGLELGGEATLPVTQRFAEGDGFRHRAVVGTLAGCGRAKWAAACAVAKLGQLEVRGLGVDQPASASGLLGQVGPRLVTSLRLGGHLSAQAHFDLLYLLSPWTVELNDLPRWTMPSLSTAAGIDLAATFP